MTLTPPRLVGWAASAVGTAWAVAVLVVALHGLTQPTILRFLAAGGWLPWHLIPWLAARPTIGHFAAILTAGGAAWWAWVLLHGGAAAGSKDLTRTFAQKDAVHGSGRWRTDREIAPALERWSFPKTVPATAPGGIVLGQRGRDSVLLTQDQHVALVGIPGVGKTRRVLLPTIGCLGKAQESLILSDPKGELYAYTADWLTAQGYRVIRLDFRDPSRSARWNPLAPIQAAWAAQQPATASRAAWQLAHALVGSGVTSEALWNNTTEALIAALALAVVTTAEPAAQHLHSAYRLLLEMGEGIDQFFTALPDRHPAREAFRTVQSAQKETLSSIFVTTTTVLRLFSDPNVAWLTAEHDAAWPMGHTAAAVLDEFAQAPVAVFLVIPDEDSTFYPLATLALSQLIGTLVDASAQAPGGRLPRRVTFLLDEFGNLPPLPDFDKAVNVGRGRGLRFVVAVQSWSQFSAVYKDKGPVIANGCAVTIYLGTNDVSTAHEFSQRVGSATVQTESHGQTVSTQAVGRSLLTVDELLRWPVGRSLILQLGQLPLALDLPDLSAWPWPFTAADPAPPRDLSAEAAALAVFPPTVEDDWGVTALDAPWDP